jgi:hypothetical protein
MPPLETVGTPVPVPELVPVPVLGPGTEPGTVLKLETVGTVLVPVPVLGPGTESGTVLELEMEAETEREQGNKYSALHP